MVEIMQEWFAAQLGKRVRLTRRAALTRDEVHEFVVADNTLASGCVNTTKSIFVYGMSRDRYAVLDGKLHCHVISGAGHHFFDVYEDA